MTRQLKKSSIALLKELGIEPPKTAAQLRRENEKAAKALPVDVKRRFWQAMLDGKTLGEARALAGINDVLVASALVKQCWETNTTARLKTIDEIV